MGKNRVFGINEQAMEVQARVVDALFGVEEDMNPGVLGFVLLNCMATLLKMFEENSAGSGKEMWEGMKSGMDELMMENWVFKSAEDCLRKDGRCSELGNNGVYCKHCDGKWGK